MITPGKLNDSLRISEDLPDRMGSPGEPGSDPMDMMMSADGRNLGREERQFADLFHERDQAAGESTNSRPFEPHDGQWAESPFSIVNPSAKEARPSAAAEDFPRPPAKPESEVETDAATEFSPAPEPLQGRMDRDLIDRLDLQSRFSADAYVRFEGEPKPTNDVAVTTPATPAEPASASPTPESLQGRMDRDLIARFDPRPRWSAGAGVRFEGEPKPTNPAEPAVGARPARPKAVEEPEQSIPAQPSGDRILQGFFGQPSTPAPSATPAAPSGSHQIDRIEQLAERLAERVLVSDRTWATDSEVRIQLRESVLQGAEITIRRDQGQLVVSFNGVNAHLAQQLLPQTDDLQRALATRLDTTVRIEVNVSSGETGDQGSPGDGRSRNRRDPRDEWGADY